MKRHKVDKHDRHGKQRSKKASKLVRRQTSKKQTKDGVREGQMQVWIGCPLLHCVEMDDTLTSKTHAWTYKQVCKDAYKANKWHKQAW